MDRIRIVLNSNNVNLNSKYEKKGRDITTYVDERNPYRIDDTGVL